MSEVWIELSNGTRFSFPLGFIESIKTSYESGVEQLKIPFTGPMNNQGFDIDGNGKTITINGRLFDTTSSVLNNSNMQSMKTMKLWLESLLGGAQEPIKFNSWLDGVSAINNIPSVVYDEVSGANVTLPATFVQTTAYVIGLTADTEEGDVEKIPFTLTLWVSGI